MPAPIRKRPYRALASALALLLSRVAAADPKPAEHEVKAALVYNLFKFVEWPADAPVQTSSAIEICVLRHPQFLEALTALSRRSVGGRTIVVRDLRDEAGAGCHVAVLGPDLGDRLEPLLQRFAQRSVLTVSDSEGYGARGVLVDFYLDEGRVRFEINVASARQARIRVSSKLLRLARVVGAAP